MIKFSIRVSTKGWLEFEIGLLTNLWLVLGLSLWCMQT